MPTQYIRLSWETSRRGLPLAKVNIRSNTIFISGLCSGGMSGSHERAVSGTSGRTDDAEWADAELGFAQVCVLGFAGGQKGLQ